MTHCDSISNPTEQIKEVINCNRYQPGSIRSSFLSLQMGQQAHTVATPVAAHAESPEVDSSGVPEIIRQMLGVIKKWDMVEFLPHPPSYFNDEPRFPALGSLLKEPWASTPDSVGAFDRTWEKASIRTLGEVIERSCHSHPRDKMDEIPFGSFYNLEDKSFDPIPFFPFSRSDANESDILDNETHWFPTRHYQTGISRLLPLRLSYLHGSEKDPVLDSIRTTSGTAMWSDYNGAIFSGLCELIERDAFFIHYLSKKTPPRVPYSILDKEIEDNISYIEKYRLEVKLFDISMEFNIPVVLCNIIDRTGVGPALSIGTKCSPDPKEAILHALLEAVQIRYFSRMNKLISDSGDQASHMLDRCLSWYDVDNISKVDFFLESREDGKLPEFKGTKETFLNNFEHDIYVSDLTLDGLKTFKVVKVNVPQLLPLYFFDDHKPIWSDRVQEYLSNIRLNEVPHPFL